MQAVALPVERVERAVEQVERVAEGPPAEERAAAVAAWSGCGPEASASASAGRDSILSNLTAENDATTKVRLAPSV